jgi:putative methionine-R-sulfoxide reductase with GAF domain
VKQPTSSTQDKPVLDEESFQQILGAAFVLQQHNDRLSTNEPKADPAQALSEIVETQKLIQTQQLDLPAAMKLIAERVQKITQASGAAIGVVEGDQLTYQAGTGNAASDSGLRVPLDACLSAECLRKGQILQCSDVKQDSRLRAELCRERGVQSLIAAPVYHEGRVAGVLELRSAAPNSFQEHDVRTSQLMAALVTEAMVRAAELEWKQTLAAERATMLQALERIKPELERLAAAPAARVEPAPVSLAVPATVSAEPAPAPPPADQSQAQSSTDICRGCGRQFGEEESYCGICGTPRLTEKSISGDIQSKWASLWHMQQAAEKSKSEKSGEKLPPSRDEFEDTSAADSEPLPAALKEIVARFTAEEEKQGRDNESADEELASSEQAMIHSSHPLSPELKEIIARFPADTEPTDEASADAAQIEADWQTGNGTQAATQEVQLRIVPAEVSASQGAAQKSPWTSAARALEWLESVKAQQRPSGIWLAKQWDTRRANIYLVISAVLLLVVLFGWESRPAENGASASSGSTSSAASARRRKNPPKPNLTLFEQLLVSLGLAEPPPTPVYLGNPNTLVWVDVHTALYYCPGAELYGKTAGGKVTTQVDAQRDQFEPAFRKACD